MNFGKTVMAIAIPLASEIRTTVLNSNLCVAMPLEDKVDQSGKIPKTGAAVNNAAAISNADFYWKSARASEVMRPMALDHSLAFHRLQEARQELHRARSGLPALSQHERAALVAFYEANLARAEQWLARTSATETMIAPPSSLPAASRLQAPDRD